MCDLIMWDKACIADRNIWYSCDDVLSYSVFFRPPVALLCSYGFTLDTTIQTGSQLKILCGWRDRTELRPKAWSITSRHQVSSCAWHMFTKKKLLFASFQSFSPSISLFLFQATRSFSPLAPPPLSSEQVIPQRASFKPFTYSPCCFLLQLSQTPTETLLWVTTRETSVPRAGSTNRGGHLKEMPKDWKTVKKTQRSAAEKDF